MYRWREMTARDGGTGTRWSVNAKAELDIGRRGNSGSSLLVSDTRGGNCPIRNSTSLAPSALLLDVGMEQIVCNTSGQVPWKLGIDQMGFVVLGTRIVQCTRSIGRPRRASASECTAADGCESGATSRCGVTVRYDREGRINPSVFG